MSWFGTPKPPVDDETGAWIDSAASWVLREFDRTAILKSATILPTPEFFPDPYDGTAKSIEPLFDRVCGYMGIDRSRIRLETYADGDEAILRALPVYSGQTGGAAGLYFDPEDGDRFVVALNESLLRNPSAVVATASHELAHVLLLGEGRVDPEKEPDHEPLTDLLTVFLGFGIFTANEAFRFGQWEDGVMQGWSASRSGYLSEEALAYSLAWYAAIRSENRPAWIRHLQLNVRHHFKSSCKYLKHSPPTELKEVMKDFR